MKDRKQRTWLILQGIWILVFLAAAFLLSGKYRTMAVFCVCACVYTLIQGLLRARGEQRRSEGAAPDAEEGKNSPEDGEKP